MSSLSGKTVLITGGARGIGAQTARVLAARGARVALVGLEPDLLEKVTAELGAGHLWHECDVTDQESVDAAVRATVDAFGGIDVVLANAGIANNGTVAVNPVEAHVRTAEVNLVGVIRTVSATLPHVTARRGHYLLVSSLAAFTVLPGMAAYCASKAGVEQFGNALRLEVAHKGVTVGTAHPGWVDTDLVRDQKQESGAFRTTLRALPWPLSVVTSVDDCANAFVEGIERRKRRVYVPRVLGAVQLLRSAVLSPVGDLPVRRGARRRIPQLEDEVKKLGRSFGRHSVG